MIRKRLLVGILFAVAFAFAGVATVSADECDHEWYELNDDYCACDICGATKPHSWGKPGWDGGGENYTIYAKVCNTCWAERKVPMTVKKSKTKRIIPKKWIKGAVKKKVYYNKSKVKATKDGKVKGKKRGTTATVKWRFKFRADGETWDEVYEVDIKIK